MERKELRRLRRSELLELLVEQGKAMEKLERELAEARAELAARQIAIDEAGTLAEAALRLNGVFEAADAAAKQYLEALEHRARGEQLEKEGAEGSQADPQAGGAGGGAEA